MTASRDISLPLCWKLQARQSNQSRVGYEWFVTPTLTFETWTLAQLLGWPSGDLGVAPDRKNWLKDVERQRPESGFHDYSIC